MTPKTMSDARFSPAIVSRDSGASGIVLVCEHASNHMPARYDNLGVSDSVLQSHVAWDPGALGVAARLSDLLDAPLVAGGLSRLIYDCNRPPEAVGAMPARSEIYDVPGNAALTDDDKAARVADIYEPFKAAVTEILTRSKATALITIHSFTPVYHGQPRSLELGVLHDQDTRLADAILVRANEYTPLKTERNEPYGPQDGVTHTLREHGIRRGLHNVMLEIRNDLIATPQQQIAMADMLAPLLRDAVRANQTMGASS